ncbi:MAG: hypothetical protein VW405_08195, partial [Rhodospirillaceae bacterium]
MIDLLGFPAPTDDGRVQWFVGSDPSANLSSHNVWNKPRGNYTMLGIVCIGSGGGGGGGAGNTSGNTAGGGQGGGPSGIARAVFPLWLVPDTLY